MKKVASIVLNDFRHDSRVLKECRTLINAGYEMAVIAMYADDLPLLETKDGLQVYRVPIATQKLPGNIFFSAVKYIHLLWKMYRIARRYDILHCNDIEALPIGVFTKWLGRSKKVVYDAHEYESEKSGVSGFRKKLLFWFERFFIRHADRVLTVGEQIALEYRRLYNIEKPAVVMNCPVLQERKTNTSLLREKLNIPAEQELILISQGTLTPDRGINETLDAFMESNRMDMALVFMGYGSLTEKIKQLASERDNIYYMPPVRPEDVVDYTSSADVGLTFIENICLSYYYSLPNKFFEYIHAGLAIISWPSYEMKSIIEEANAGIVTDDFSKEAIVKVLKSLDKVKVEQYKKQSSKLKYKFSWQKQEAVLMEVYKYL
jgi:glycosyltransferase involved in cell wall biosynthesis